MYNSDLDDVQKSNIDSSFNRIFHQQKSLVMCSEKKIHDYVLRRNQLFINKLSKKFMKKRNN